MGEIHGNSDQVYYSYSLPNVRPPFSNELGRLFDDLKIESPMLQVSLDKKTDFSPLGIPVV